MTLVAAWVVRREDGERSALSYPGGERTLDTVTLITSALIGGASAGLKDTATQSVRDAYAGLKALLQRRFRGRNEAEVALAQHEAKPEVWAPALREELVQAGADQDEEILEATRHLMALLDPAGASAGKYQVQFNAPVQGVVMGDHAEVTQTFQPQTPGA
jgi:hypothetical protein